MCKFFDCVFVLSIGPTAIMALMIQKYVHDSADFAVLIAFLSGFIIFLLGVLNLGFLVQFISVPVTIGFTSAAAITIGSSQIKSLFGLPGTANDFLDAWENVFRYIGETKLWDTVLGILTVIFLLLLQVIYNRSTSYFFSFFPPIDPVFCNVSHPALQKCRIAVRWLLVDVLAKRPFLSILFL